MAWHSFISDPAKKIGENWEKQKALGERGRARLAATAERIEKMSDRHAVRMDQMMERADTVAHIHSMRDMEKTMMQEARTRYSEGLAGVASKGESLAHRLGRRGYGGTALDATKGAYNASKSGVKKAGKFGLIGAAAVAGVVGLGVMANSWRKGRATASKDEAQAIAASAGDNIPQVMSADMMAQQQTMMGVPPQPGEHAARVMAGRGMAPQLGAGVNPAMTAVPEESVAPLGGPGRA